MKHTPGPWTFEHFTREGYGNPTEYKEIVGPLRPDTSRNIIAEVHMNHDTHEADGRLIAAAPELLEIVEAMEDRLTRLLALGKWSAASINEDLEKVRAAIKKATP